MGEESELELEFDRIYRAYRQRVLDYAAKLIGRDEADDVARAVFLKVHRSLGKLTEASKLTPWIYTITLNTVRDCLEEARLPHVAFRGRRGPVAGSRRGRDIAPSRHPHAHARRSGAAGRDDRLLPRLRPQAPPPVLRGLPAERVGTALQPGDRTAAVPVAGHGQDPAGSGPYPAQPGAELPLSALYQRAGRWLGRRLGRSGLRARIRELTPSGRAPGPGRAPRPWPGPLPRRRRTPPRPAPDGCAP